MTASAEQVFVILRADAYEENDSVVEHVTAKKVVLDESRANKLRQDAAWLRDPDGPSGFSLVPDSTRSSRTCRIRLLSCIALLERGSP